MLATNTTDLVSFNIGIHCLGKRGQWRPMMELYEQMKRRGIAPDLFTFSTMMDACGKHGQTKDLYQLWREMREHGLVADVTVYTTMLDAIGCRRRQLDEMMELFDRMHHEGIQPDQKTFGVLIHAFGSAGDTRTMLSLYERLKRAGLRPNCAICTAIVHAYAISGQTDRMLDFLDKMSEQDHVRPNARTFTTVIAAFARKGQLDRMTYYYDLMRAHGLLPDSTLLHIVVRASSRNLPRQRLPYYHPEENPPDPLERIQRYIDDMRSLHVRPDGHLQLALMQLCLQSGHYEIVWQLASRQLERGLQENCRSEDGLSPDYVPLSRAALDTLLRACNLMTDRTERRQQVLTAINSLATQSRFYHSRSDMDEKHVRTTD